MLSQEILKIILSLVFIAMLSQLNLNQLIMMKKIVMRMILSQLKLGLYPRILIYVFIDIHLNIFSLYLVQELHNAFCDGAALNPDEVEEDEGDFCYNPDEVLDHLDSIVTGPEDDQPDDQNDFNNDNEGYDDEDFGME